MKLSEFLTEFPDIEDLDDESSQDTDVVFILTDSETGIETKFTLERVEHDYVLNETQIHLE